MKVNNSYIVFQVSEIRFPAPQSGKHNCTIKEQANYENYMQLTFFSPGDYKFIKYSQKTGKRPILST